jgi:hypothetical protein
MPNTNHSYIVDYFKPLINKIIDFLKDCEKYS